MKKSLLCLVLFLALSLCASSSWALMDPIHEAEYWWYYNPDGETYGTLVNPALPDPSESPWTIGDTSGILIARVREKVWDLGDSVGQFSWTVTNTDNDHLLIPDTINSFHVRSMGFEPTWVMIPDGWHFFHEDGYYSWEREEGAGIPLNTPFDNMQVRVNTTLWEISNGGIDWEGVIGQNPDGSPIFGEVIGNGNGYWRTSHPAVPEPSSMLLLGIGLFGLGGAVRKRFKA